MKITKHYCDVCNAELASDNKLILQVIFTTEQNEGRRVPPHFSTEYIDICSTCELALLAGNYLFASGAQGHNKYWFSNSAKVSRSTI